MKEYTQVPGGWQATDDPKDFIPENEFQSSEEKYGGISGSLKAGALGIARGVSLSGSDWALTQSGLMTPEDIEGYSEENPIASVGGEMVGTVGSILAAPEVGIAKALLPAAGLAKIGMTVTKGAEALNLGKLATKGSIASKVLEASNKLGASAAGSAMEGALYSGISSTIHESALGDESLNGEKVLSNFGYGALWGGGLGAIFKGASMAIPASIGAAREGIVKLKNIIAGTGVDDAGVVGKIFPNAKFTEAIKNRTIDLDKNGTNALIRESTDALNDVHNNIQTSVKELNTKIRPEEAEALINSSNPENVVTGVKTSINEIDAGIKKIRSEPELYDQSYARDLELQKDGLLKLIKEEIPDAPKYNEFTGIVEDIAPTKTEVKHIDAYKRLRQTKQYLQEVESSSKMPSRIEQNSMNIVSGVKQTIDKITKNPEVFGELGTKLANHDEFLHKYYKLIPRKGTSEFQTAFMTKTGSGRFTKYKIDPTKVENVFKQSGNGNIKALDKMKLLDDYFEFVKTAPDHIENTLMSVPNESINTSALKTKIEDTSDLIVKNQKDYINASQNAQKAFGLEEKALPFLAAYNPILAVGVGVYKAIKDPIKTAHQLAKIERVINKTSNSIGKGAKGLFEQSRKVIPAMIGPSSRLSDEERQKKFKTTHDRLTQLNNDPASLVDRMYAKTQNINESAPKIAQSIQLSAIRANQFLASKLPMKPDSNPLDDDHLPSIAEMEKYERYEDLIENPMIALDHVKHNMVTPETIETLTTVYPKLYDEMKLTILEEVTDRVSKKEKFSYQLKQSISMFLGTPIDSSLIQQSIFSNQRAFPIAQQEINNKMKVSQQGMDKMDISGRLKNVRHEEV